MTALSQRLSPQVPSLMEAYRARLQAEGWVADVAQVQAVVRLEHLAQALATSDTATPPQGLYFYGPVGRGKSLVMNLFFETVTVPKRRVHFHAFMQELHARMHATRLKPGQDLMQVVAAQVASEAVLLCFDEFYVTNIADAMLLGRLFEALVAQGVVMVATSNWPMDGLFQGGVNRDRFVPFIKLMQRYMELLAIGEGRDYRVQAGAVPVHYVVARKGLPVAPQLQVLFDQFAGGEASPLPPELHPKRQAGRTYWFTFADLCEQNTDAATYMALADACDTLVLEGVPVLTAAEANAALRLVALVDIWYEQGKRLVVGAAAMPHELCVAGDAAEAFKRTASRLMQMTTVVREPSPVPVRERPVRPDKVAKPHTRRSKVARAARREC